MTPKVSAPIFVCVLQKGNQLEHRGHQCVSLQASALPSKHLATTALSLLHDIGNCVDCREIPCTDGFNGF